MYPREQALIRHYDNHPTYHSSIRKDVFHFLPIQGRTALDLGCGDGRLTPLLRERGFEVTGVDYSPVRITLAKEHDGTFICSDLHRYLLSCGNFDVGCVFEVLEHLEDPTSVMGMLKERCKIIVGSVPLNMPYVAHLQVYTSANHVRDEFDVDVITKDGFAYFRGDGYG